MYLDDFGIFSKIFVQKYFFTLVQVKKKKKKKEKKGENPLAIFSKIVFSIKIGTI